MTSQSVTAAAAAASCYQVESLRIELCDKQDQLDALSAQMTEDAVRAEQAEAQITQLQQQLQQQQKKLQESQAAAGAQYVAAVISPRQGNRPGRVDADADAEGGSTGQLAPSETADECITELDHHVYIARCACCLGTLQHHTLYTGVQLNTSSLCACGQCFSSPCLSYLLLLQTSKSCMTP